MALLSFPTSPVNGQLYPTSPVLGQNQYQWEAATNTWRLVGTATGVTAGTYGDADNIPQITVDVTGNITVATNIPIGQNFVKTNNPGAYNAYTWPTFASPPAGAFLQTDAAGVLSWSATPFINYWQLIGGTTLEPVVDGYELILTDNSGNVTFFAENTGALELVAAGGVSSSFIRLTPDNTLSEITVGSGTTGTAEPLVVRGEALYLAAYGNSFLNTPSTITLTQTELNSDVNISTDGSLIANANSANSFATPPTRGNPGEYLISNGNGTTTWSSSGFVNYWVRNTLTPALEPAFPGDSVEVVDISSIPRVILDPTGKVKALTGLKSLTMDSNYAANTSRLVSITNSVDPGILNLSGSSVVLQPWGNSFANASTTFTVYNSSGVELKSTIGGVPTTLFTVDLAGDLSVGRYIDSLAPSLHVDGVSGNVSVGGRLTVNAGVPIPGVLTDYTFPPNRGVLDYVLFTNADGTTRWDNINSVSGYWTESFATTELYPTTQGQHVQLRDGGGTVSIDLNANGYITALGGDAINPTYGFFGNRTGFYGGTTDQINIGVNGTKVAKFDDNFFYCYEDINFVGAATNPGADSVIENTNTELLFSASTSSSLFKSIVFENAQNNEVGRFKTTGDFTVNEGNAAIGSTVINTTLNSITLSIGSNNANQAGRLKLYSIYNGGNGFELFQDPASGNVTLALNSTALPTLTLSSTTVTVDADEVVTGDLTVDNDFYLPSPTVPPAASSAGTAGQIAWDANYVYVCIATNTWKRSPLTTW